MRNIFLLVLLLSAAPAHIVSAQETINYASVSGRVTDPSAAVVPGAEVTARQTDTNLTASAVTDQEGRFRFPYLKVGPYEFTVHLQGFADAHRSLTLTIASAFELPVTLTVGGVDTSVTVTGEATVIEGARSQIAGTVSHAEVKNLPLNGRNFLDLALLVPGVSPPNISSTQLFAETSAVPGVGISGRQPAQLFQQLHRGRPLGQRRCRRAQRHSVRRGCRGSVSGGHLGRAGGTGRAPWAATSTS